MNNQLSGHSYGEAFLTKCLQQRISLRINNKTVKRGRFLLFRRNHFFIQITILNEKNQRESFEIPFPLKAESYDEEGLLYFDYRLSSLNLKSSIFPTKKVSSTYYNKILEIQIES